MPVCYQTDRSTDHAGVLSNRAFQQIIPVCYQTEPFNRSYQCVIKLIVQQIMPVCIKPIVQQIIPVCYQTDRSTDHAGFNALMNLINL